MSKKIARLFMVTSDYHFLRGEHVYTTGSFLRFVPELLRFCNRIEICVPVHPASDSEGYSIERDEIAYRPLPPSRTIEQFIRRFPVDGIAICRALYQGMRKASLVWINGPHPLQPLAVLIARLARKPYLLYARGDIVAVVRPKYSTPTTRNRMALRAAEYLDHLIDLSARDSVLLYVGSNLERYARNARYARSVVASLLEESQLAQRHKTRLHKPVRLLWAGQLRPVKGLLYLLAAVQSLVVQGYGLHLTIVGDGEQREELCRYLREHNMESVVEMTGYIAPDAELTAYFESADIFVLPSLSEGVPKVLLEAMGHALPVAASDVGGVKDLVRDGENGILFSPADPSAIADAIKRLIEDGKLRRQISGRALSFAREHTATAEVARIREAIMEALPSLWR